ncbi:MAG TPA: hypothetical protein VNT53_11210 [Pseudolysinimonas sp.]|nr:hypothetical protein [Pseudolysinimonas sp.]
MSSLFTLADSPALDDLQVYLSRAARVEEGSVRLIAGGGVLAVYTAILYPAGLLDESPTVLGLRTVALAKTDDKHTAFDAVVPIRSLLQRLERAQTQRLDTPEAPVTISLPIEVNTVTWAAISPPKGGWLALDGTNDAILDAAARNGIDEVSTAVPEGAGEQIVRKVRSEIWGRPIAGLEHVPAGAGFAALSLGFLGDETVRIYETGPWTRLTTERGHVLVKRKAWTLSR